MPRGAGGTGDGDVAQHAGRPWFGSQLADRYAVIGEAIDVGAADVVCFQEVFSWWHLRLLARRMRSFGHVSFRPSPAGPAGGW